MDLKYIQNVPFGKRYNAQIDVDFFNVFNSQTGYNIEPRVARCRLRHSRRASSIRGASRSRSDLTSRRSRGSSRASSFASLRRLGPSWAAREAAAYSYLNSRSRAISGLRRRVGLFARERRSARRGRARSAARSPARA